jgi:hypothetical protein
MHHTSQSTLRKSRTRRAEHRARHGLPDVVGKSGRSLPEPSTVICIAMSLRG